MQNYAKSYTNGASEFSSEFSLWPHEYKKGDLKQGEESIEDYANKKYFKNLEGL